MNYISSLLWYRFGSSCFIDPAVHTMNRNAHNLFAGLKLGAVEAALLEMSGTYFGYHRKTMGNPWENHRKTMGKAWENGGLMGFTGIYPLVMTNSLPT